MILSVINNKGGTGKTTTSIQLASVFAARGLRVLLVDLDAQASASLAMGVPWTELSPSLYDCLAHPGSARIPVRRTGEKAPDLITADMSLANADLLLADRPGRETVLAELLAPLTGRYDLIFCDCPPSLSLLAVNAFMASRFFLVPVTLEYMALEGVISLLDAVERLRCGMRMTAEIAGILLTMVQPRLIQMRRIRELLRGRYGPMVLQTEIPRDARLAEAPAFSHSIFEHAPDSRGAGAYARLADEVWRRIHPSSG